MRSWILVLVATAWQTANAVTYVKGNQNFEPESWVDETNWDTSAVG